MARLPPANQYETLKSLSTAMCCIDGAPLSEKRTGETALSGEKTLLSKTRPAVNDAAPMTVGTWSAARSESGSTQSSGVLRPALVFELPF